MEFGPWMMVAFRVLAALRGVRGTWLDVFGRSHERRLERKLIADFEFLLDEIASDLTVSNHSAAVALTELAMEIRGYGYIKDANCEKAMAKQALLMESFRKPVPEETERLAALTVAAE